MNHYPFQPEPIDVVKVNDQPYRVVLKKRLRKVKEISNLWRIDDNWWAKSVTRLYYTLELDSGGRITVFCDLSDKKWYRQNWTT
jgi:hypothetical protein